MKKVVRLTESDLVRIVKRVINESDRNLLTENIEYGGVKMAPLNPTNGGPIVLTYKGKSMRYTISVVVTKNVFGAKMTAYQGKIAVVSMWKEPNKGYFVKDNTDKVFQIPLDELGKMANAAKNNDKKVYIAGTGSIKGIEGDFKATLTQTA